MDISCDELLELRRNAYIACTNLYMEKNNVVGIFGDGVSVSGDHALPLALIYGCGLVPVPIEGVDAEVFKFGNSIDTDDLCDVIKSTLIYLTTDKCPLLYSSRMYVCTNYCYDFCRQLKHATTKPIFFFDVTKKNSSDQKMQEHNLLKELCSIYHCEYSEEKKQAAEEKLCRIEKILERLENYSDLGSDILFLLRYYTPYITDLNERAAFFTKLEIETNCTEEKKERPIIRSLCPRGNYRKILAQYDSEHVLIRRAFSNCAVGYDNCILSRNTKNYGY